MVETRIIHESLPFGEDPILTVTLSLIKKGTRNEYATHIKNHCSLGLFSGRYFETYTDALLDFGVRYAREVSN